MTPANNSPVTGTDILKDLNSNSKERLGAAISEFEEILNFRLAKACKKEKDASLESAYRLLALAKAGLNAGKTEYAWHCFKVATQMEIYILDTGEISNRATYIWQEANAKLTSWRRLAIEDLLGEESKLKQNHTADGLFMASSILNGHIDNIYHKNRLVKDQILMLLIAGIVTSCIWIILYGFNFITLNPTANSFIFSVVFWGIMGASIFGIFSSLGNKRDTRIPDQLMEKTILFSRLFIGGISAVVVFAALKAGILTFKVDTLDSWFILLVSFFAGFSERLLLKALEVISN